MTAEGPSEYDPGERGLSLYFGPCTRVMPLIAHGSFRVVTISFAPGGTLGLDLPAQSETTDRIMSFDPFTSQTEPLPNYAPQSDAESWLLSAEQQLMKVGANAFHHEPQPLLGAFERFCLTNPGNPLDEFSDHQAITRRTLERTIGRDWGVSPKFALRRARALDMAAALLGVAPAEEEPELRLRYYDESHLIREIRHFFDTTPRKLRDEPHPLLTITMEIRQSRRLEALARLRDDEPRPWRDPAAEPPGVNRTRS